MQVLGNLTYNRFDKDNDDDDEEEDATVWGDLINTS